MARGFSRLVGSPSGARTSAAPVRFAFLDVLRGIAIILMVLNHTARWWTDVSMGWPRYWLVYGTMLLPAAIFLFLVGFCLPLSLRRTPGAPLPPLGPAMVRYVRRGATIVAWGLVLNILVFRTEPFWSWGVLQTIGLAVILVAPGAWLMDRAWGRWVLATTVVLAYVLFALSYPALTAWVVDHPVLARVFFFEFPPWPWIAAAFVGLVFGWLWLDARARGPEVERRYFVAAALVGVACLVAYVAWESWMPTAPRFGFRRDFLVNRHWTPRGATLSLVGAGVALLLALTYWLTEVRRIALPRLTVLGQTALVLYFVHQLIALTFVNEALGVRFNHWVAYWAANAALMVTLIVLGHAWLAVKRLARRGVAPLPARAERSRRAG